MTNNNKATTNDKDIMQFCDSLAVILLLQLKEQATINKTTNKCYTGSSKTPARVQEAVDDWL